MADLGELFLRHDDALPVVLDHFLDEVDGHGYQSAAVLSVLATHAVEVAVLVATGVVDDLDAELLAALPAVDGAFEVVRVLARFLAALHPAGPNFLHAVPQLVADEGFVLAGIPDGWRGLVNIDLQTRAQFPVDLPLLEDLARRYTGDDASRRIEVIRQLLHDALHSYGKAGYQLEAQLIEAAAEFGRRVRARRNELGLSQEALADVTRLHWTFVGQVERGRRDLTLHNMFKLAAALQVDPGELVRGVPAP